MCLKKERKLINPIPRYGNSTLLNEEDNDLLRVGSNMNRKKFFWE